MSTDPTAEHIDAVAVEFEHVVVGSGYYAMNIGTTAACEAAREILTSDNPETHAALAASLPAEVMLAALVDREKLTEQLRVLRPCGCPAWRAAWACCDGDASHVVERSLTWPWEVAP